MDNSLSDLKIHKDRYTIENKGYPKMVILVFHWDLSAWWKPYRIVEDIVLFMIAGLKVLFLNHWG